MAAKEQYRNEEEREKWLSVIKPEVMCSAESGEDDSEVVIIVHLYRRCQLRYIIALKQQLDEEI